MIHGNVDLRAPGRVEGWCYDSANPSLRLLVSVMYNGQELATVVARKHRPDLAFIHKDADYAFFVPIPEVADPSRLAVRVHAPGAVVELPCNGRVLIPRVQPAPLIGRGTPPEPCANIILWNGVWEDNRIERDAEAFFRKVGGNTGNLAFATAIFRSCQARKGPDWSEVIQEAGAVAILPCANQLGEHCDMKGCPNRVAASACSVVAIGLGAQAGLDGAMPRLQPSTMRWVERIIARAPSPGYPNISLRGHFSQKVMEHYGWGGHGVVLGCPSLFYAPEPDLGRRAAARLRQPARVCVVAGQPVWSNMRPVEPWLTRLVSRTGGAYVVQDPLFMLRLAMGQAAQVTPEEFEAFRAWALPDLNRQETLAWLRRHAVVFSNLDDWIDFYRDFDFVIGARIHGVVLALQAGVPALCVAHDSRTRELCEIMRIPSIAPERLAQGVEPEDLPALFEFDPEEFDRNRQILKTAYRDFLEHNRIMPRQGFFGMREESGPVIQGRGDS